MMLHLMSIRLLHFKNSNLHNISDTLVSHPLREAPIKFSGYALSPRSMYQCYSTSDLLNVTPADQQCSGGDFF